MTFFYIEGDLIGVKLESPELISKRLADLGAHPNIFLLLATRKNTKQYIP